MRRYNAELDEGKRKAIFAEFQKRFYDQAIATKAGNYGILPGRDVAAEELRAVPDSRACGGCGSTRRLKRETSTPEASPSGEFGSMVRPPNGTKTAA